jgi:hypothetical protein
VKYLSCFAYHPAHGLRVTDISDLDVDQISMGLMEPAKVVLHSWPGQVVEEQNRLPGTQEAVRQIGSDESSPSGDEDRTER